jgi:hypothetical protein
MNHLMSSNAQWQADLFRKAGLLPRRAIRSSQDGSLSGTTDTLVHTCQGHATQKDESSDLTVPGRKYLSLLYEAKHPVMSWIPR